MTLIASPIFSTLSLTSIVPTLTKLLAKHQQKINDCLNTNTIFTWDNLLQPLEDMANELERYWSPISHMHAVINSSELRNIYTECLPLLSAHASAIGHNQPLYLAIKSIDQSVLTNAQKQCIKHQLHDFELSGVALSTENKQRFEVITARLSELANQFETNLLDATEAYTLLIADLTRLDGVPSHTIEQAVNLAKQKNLTGALLTLEYPCYQAVLTYAHDRKLREEFYHAYVTRASEVGPYAGKFDNSNIMTEILALRHEEANLLGFENYAKLSLATKMAPSVEVVHQFLNDLSMRSLPKARCDFTDLQTFANETHADYGMLQPWDIAYLSEQKKQACYKFSDEMLRPYFPLEHVLKGMIKIIHTLYGMTMEPLLNVDLWHKDVICYRIHDEQGVLRGDLYLDLFARPQKRGGAWMDALQSRFKHPDGTIQHPIATLTCNFTPKSAHKPATLSHDEVITLFHEMGHCLQHVLTTVDTFSVSGIHGVEWDAVELPSQFFENWCWAEESLRMLTAHVDTHEPLPADLFTALLAAKNFQAGLAMTRQLLFSMFDFELHEKNATNITALFNTLQTTTTVTPTVTYSRFPHSFGHIFAGGYAAGYYSYKWAEVLSCDAFARFTEEGLFNPQLGRDFLHEILETGSSRDALEAFIRFRKREPNVDALLRDNGIIPGLSH